MEVTWRLKGKTNLSGLERDKDLQEVFIAAAAKSDPAFGTIAEISRK